MGEGDSGADRKQDKTVPTLLARCVDKRGLDAMRKALDELNRALKPNPEVSLQGLRSYTSSTLARFLQYFALTKMLEKPGRRGSDRPPKGATYELLSARYDKFEKQFNTNIGQGSRLIPSLHTGTVRDFCSFHTFSTGSDTERFYSGLALFVVDLAEQGEFRSDFFMRVLPVSEVAFPNEVGAWLLERSADILAGVSKVESTENDPPIKSENLSVSVNFDYSRNNKRELDQFISEFQIEELDKCAHFICYRPRLSEPRELIKTYLTIKPSWASHGVSQSENTNFNHFYAAPGRRNHQYHRISNGRVVPLDEGVYLVGGHKLRNRDRIPFRSVEIISLEWSYLKNLQAVFPALMISANNRDTHLATRLALRATPLHHSTKVSIGAIGVEELADDIRKDLVAEARLIEEDQIAGYFERQHLSQPDDADSIAERILEFCNNLPPKWRLDSEYLASSDTETKPLTPSQIEAKLEEVFGSDENPAYFRDDGRPFAFWSSIRFGVLSSK